MCINLTHKMFKIDRVNSCKLHYQLILKKFLDNLKYKELSDDYINCCKNTIKNLLIYFKINNVNHISKVTNDIIFSYILTLDKYSQSTRYNRVSKIRIFFKFIYLNNITLKDFSLAIPKMKINHNKKIPNTIWSADEICKILNSIDTSTTIGIRDYAIFMLLTNLGLRFSDVKNLKFEDVDWKMNILNITQNKTKKIVTLPLLNDVGVAIINYIKKGRPNVDSKYIFLNKKNEKFSAKSNFYYVFQKYLKLANIDTSNKKYIGTYSLRHSLASTLLQNRVPLSTISSILGHTDINNTAIYLKVDIPSLRECCLTLEVD